MADIIEYQTVIDLEGVQMSLKGAVDGDPKYDPDPPYWLSVKVSPTGQFCGETELFVNKSDIAELVDQLTVMHDETKGEAAIRCAGWGSHIELQIGSHGELFISGQLNKRWDEENNHLKFRLASDQSIIPHLTQVLKRLIAD